MGDCKIIIKKIKLDMSFTFMNNLKKQKTLGTFVTFISSLLSTSRAVLHHHFILFLHHLSQLLRHIGQGSQALLLVPPPKSVQL